MITIQAIADHGVATDQVVPLAKEINACLANHSAEDAWKIISQQLLTRDHPFSLHLMLFSHIYPKWPAHPEGAPAWIPSENQPSNIANTMAELHFANYQELYAWSIHSYIDFLQYIIHKLITFRKKPDQWLQVNKTTQLPHWLVGAKMNIIDSIFVNASDKTAIIYREKQQIKKISYDELNALTNRIANSLSQRGFVPGDPIAIAMPMTMHAVAIYIGIIKMGGVVVGVADSFSADEIAIRLAIAKTKAIVTQDFILRDGKRLDLYVKIKRATTLQAIVLPFDDHLHLSLDPGDLAWNDFLMTDAKDHCYVTDPMTYCTILFSSGTTGTPKAIPWTHVTAIKAASDGYFHQDIQPHDVIAWPTNLGWMMGPWLVFAGLINHATIALYDDAPNQRAFGEFIQEAGVTILGLVPAIVAQWRKTGCMECLDWRQIKLFSSTGECSNPVDMLYLMSLAGYKPIIEYCGGTEIGGAYITSTIVEKNYPSMFTTPALGSQFILMDEKGNPTDDGEVALIPPAIGLSTELLNADHHEIYFKDMPAGLRRHGDHLKRFNNGTYLALGRVDDTMNLSGIKISSAEIERVLVGAPGVIETAAIAVQPVALGPSQLVIFAVCMQPMQKNELLTRLQLRINQHLNPLFKISDLVLIEELPKTVSNKIMRRVLRNQYQSIKI